MPKALRALAVGAAALGLVGCGTGGLARTGDANHGKQLFAQKCAGCHTLADAGSQATVGPNLDNAFYADRKQGFKESSIMNVVLDQIRIAILPMPANLVRGQDARDVAAYVASVAGTEQALATAKAAQASAGSTDGKTIFKANCASCHTLKDAGTTGQVGPNLDQLKPPPTFAIVKRQVTFGGAAMPAFKGRLTDAQITAVAKYVSSVVGK